MPWHMSGGQKRTSSLLSCLYKLQRSNSGHWAYRDSKYSPSEPSQALPGPSSVLRTRKQVSALPTFSCPTLLTSNLFHNPFLLIPSTLAKLHSFSGLDPCLCLGLTSLITGNITCASDFPAYLCSSSVPTTHGICI